jgi:hypothetical protein
MATLFFNSPVILLEIYPPAAMIILRRR